MSEASARDHIGKLDLAKQLLQQTLADGEVANTKVKELATAHNISERTLWDAAKALGVITSGGPGSKWKLPANSANPATNQTDAPLHGLQSSTPLFGPKKRVQPTTNRRPSLFRYPGGKFFQAPHYARVIGTCETINEPFVGGGHVTVYALLRTALRNARASMTSILASPPFASLVRRQRQ